MKRSSQEKVQVKKENGSFSESIVRYFNAKTVSCYRLTVFFIKKCQNLLSRRLSHRGNPRPLKRLIIDNEIARSDNEAIS